MVVIAVTGSLIFQALLENYGRKAAGLTAILVGLVPMMLSVLIAVNRQGMITPAVWMAGICPVSWPVYGAGLLVPDSGLPRDMARAFPNAFWFWQGVALLVTGWLLLKLRESRAKISHESKDEYNEMDA